MHVFLQEPSIMPKPGLSLGFGMFLGLALVMPFHVLGISCSRPEFEGWPGARLPGLPGELAWYIPQLRNQFAVVNPGLDLDVLRPVPQWAQEKPVP